MVELFADPTEDVGVWLRAYDDPNHEDEWEKVYGNFDAAVDVPTCVFYKELSERYPDAKVILTRRSADSWYKSVENTIYKSLQADFSDKPEQVKKAPAMVAHVLMGGVLEREREFKDKEHICALHDKHNEEVIKTIPADRLLILDLGEGWERLCKFLDKDVPNEPYPLSNSTADYPAVFSAYLGLTS